MGLAELSLAIACFAYKPVVVLTPSSITPMTIAASDNRGTVVNRGGKGRKGYKGASDGKSQKIGTTSNLDERV